MPSSRLIRTIVLCTRGCVPALLAMVIGVAQAADQTARLGIVYSISTKSPLRGFDGFWGRLQQLGWTRGQNLIVEERLADGDPQRFPQLMKELVERNVDVIVAGSTPAALAAKNATQTIPIVLFSVGDPVGAGLVPSLAHPGGNITGFSTQATDELPGKWLELMHEALPGVANVTVIFNPGNRLNTMQWQQLQQYAQAVHITLNALHVSKANELAPAFKRVRGPARAALVLTDPLTIGHRRDVIAAAASNRVPTMYTMLEFADDGGLMAHGVDHTLQMRRSAEYVDRILRGTRAGELPIEQPGQFKVVLNVKAARALGINIPEHVLMRADEIIR